MELNPRAWGRVAQLALVALVAVRLPSLVGGASAAAAVGGLLGATLASILVVGVVRHLVVTYGEPDAPDVDAA
ncbi:MAG: hypothetical protein HQRvContig02_2 [Haloquadratum phage sp.]|nr:MAG: hypothetical protein HQRvContig02_2 [Haloquadratum phage sp.]